MRKPTYLSYSAMSLYHKDEEMYFLRYLTDYPTNREPQTQPMSVGSAFDAYVKSYLFSRLVDRKEAVYEFDYMFTSQVEAHNRDTALVDGKTVFDFYKKHGALSDLILDMEGCVGEPRFETEITGLVGTSNKIGTVPILGKPDIYFITKDGARIIFDWKVNGFYSKWPPSPKSGYIKMFPGGGCHRDCQLYTHRGFTINSKAPLNHVDTGWAEQLSTYAWVLGEPIGGDFITVIDQLVCNATTQQHRIARHSALVMEKFQNATYDKYWTCWNAIQTGHVFRNLSYEDNLTKIKTLEAMSQSSELVSPEFAALTDTGQKRWR